MILISNPMDFVDFDFDFKSVFDEFCDWSFVQKSKIISRRKIMQIHNFQSHPSLTDSSAENNFRSLDIITQLSK